ncbi:unnamed protein product [Ophioblennius macclurei]
MTFQLPTLLLLLLLPLTADCWPKTRPRDCSQLGVDVSLPSQVYTIYPTPYGRGIEVFCDMETDLGGWTVFLKRDGGDQHFFKPWEDYEKGFGDPASEHWLGLRNLYKLTHYGYNELRVVLEDFEGNIVYANYHYFQVGDQCSGYTLYVGGFQDGGAGDSLSYHSGQQFSTFDHDQDSSETNCAHRYLGGFWYNECYHCNPTGIYQYGPVIDFFSNGIIWSRWKGDQYSVKSLTMMIRAYY